MFESVNRRTDGRRLDWYTISSPLAKNLPWVPSKGLDSHEEGLGPELSTEYTVNDLIRLRVISQG